MIKHFPATVLGLAIAAASLGVVAEESNFSDSLADAISGGKATLSLRYRYEFVDQDGPLDEANASTIRTRLNYQTKALYNVSAFIEADNNSYAGNDNYNDLTGDARKTRYAVVADPTYTELNQAYVDYAAPVNTLARYGRQRINLDNQRFVGSVAWRQNEQTFDAFALVNTFLPETTVTVANITNVNTILDTNINGENHQVVHLQNKSLALLNASAYAYLLDNISDTYGLRLSGAQDVNELKLSYALEYASLETDNAASNEADYMLAELGLNVSIIETKLGYEVLGSDDGTYGFDTPLATKHAFNGWADKFLNTPANGLQDTYLSVGTKALGPNIAVIYHQFDADEGSSNYGDEVDFVVSQKFLNNYEAMLKFAQYNADEFATDTAKVWLQLSAAF